MVEEGNISKKSAKDIFKKAFSTGQNPIHIIERKGIGQITNENEIKSVITEVLNQHSKEKDQYKEGNNKVLNFFMGEVMKISKGKADPELASKLIHDELLKRKQ